jgi:hypothetical protein
MAALSLFLACSAEAEILAYKTDDGVYSYTDDPEKVPPKYRGVAVAIPTTPLAEQPRTSIVQPDAGVVGERLSRRLDVLREANVIERRAAERSKRDQARAAEAAKPVPALTIIVVPRNERPQFRRRTPGRKLEI